MRPLCIIIKDVTSYVFNNERAKYKILLCVFTRLIKTAAAHSHKKDDYVRIYMSKSRIKSDSYIIISKKNHLNKLNILKYEYTRIGV